MWMLIISLVIHLPLICGPVNRIISNKKMLIKIETRLNKNGGRGGGGFLCFPCRCALTPCFPQRASNGCVTLAVVLVMCNPPSFVFHPLRVT